MKISMHSGIARNSARISRATACLIATFMIGFTSIAMADGKTCLWEGRAPACNGECRAGYTLAKRDKAGDGKKCVTGTKAYCCLSRDVIIRGAAPFCNGKCKKGEEMMGDSDYGPNGKKCQTGKAAICGVKVK